MLLVAFAGLLGLISGSIAKSACLGKPDGANLIPDIFSYVLCDSEQEYSYEKCDENKVFDPIYRFCRDGGLYNLTNFCVEKPDGQYRNPWNCHSFISCLNNTSYNANCSLLDLVYNPYKNNCESSLFFPCKVLDNQCSEKTNGKYLISDVFAFLQCSSQQESFVNCPDNQIFDPIYCNCMDGKDYNLNNFCIGRITNEYLNPWNCHSFIACLNNSIEYINSCESNDFYYDPYANQCIYSSIFPCHTINMTESICVGKPDGAYPIPDVFAYVSCRSEKEAFLQECEGNQIFDPLYSYCRDPGLINFTNFCVDKPDGQYRNPWNCHHFISCLSKISYTRACAIPELVYDPYNNVCEDSSIFPCRVLDNPCAEIADGKYLIPDVFAYLQCSSQQGSYVNCPDNQIFDPKYSNCMDAKDYNLNNFCIGKLNYSDEVLYRNPWNCHNFIMCYENIPYNDSCIKPEFVFDPYIYFQYNTGCNHGSIFPCRALNSSERICLGKPDGAYLIPDVFSYIICQSQLQNELGWCEGNQIFDPKYSICRDAGLYGLNNFCVGKQDGQYRNPWNCHSFISCLNSISYNISCAIPELVYDPYDNLCEDSSIFPCKVLDNPCAGIDDGKLLIPDVFAYLQCSSQQGSYVNCPDNQIFDPRYNNCRDAKEYNFNNFCVGKITDSTKYRNPWNCHSFIGCWDVDQLTMNVSCKTPELVFDPYISFSLSTYNLCEYPVNIFPCRTLNTSDNICLGKPDGAHLVPDVFVYLKCRLQEQNGNLEECGWNQIFDPTHSRCRDGGLFTLNNFCVGKPDGHYRNPRNCHSFISCLNSVSYNVSCENPDLVYDPYFDICEDSSIFPCKVLDNQCAGKADGKYLIQDVFAYMQCSSQQVSYVNCPDNQIFDQRYANCRDAKDYNFINFCIGKVTDWTKYRNPWNCHRFIYCAYNGADIWSCNSEELVYDPYFINPSNDICEYPSIYPCRTLNASKTICLGKPDGARLIPDVFAYVICHLQEEPQSTGNCGGNQIFDPIYSLCRDAWLYSLKKFCVGKEDGHYRNPWNCHSFISCLNSVSYNVSCAIPELVYNPYFDVCEHSSIFNCKVLDNPCAGKGDGKYLIQDLFAYLQCSSLQGSYVNCPDNQIFDPRYSNCRDAKYYNFNNLCIGKIANKNYRNPWNCHSYIKCDNNIPENMTCLHSDFVYDPYLLIPPGYDFCENSSINPCRTLNSSGNVCEDKSYGAYIIPDVFVYIICQIRQVFFKECGWNQIFDPIYSNCRDVRLYSLKNFCLEKPDGHYRNPWNCHSFISCLNNISYNVSCATPDLVYDPYFDICEDSSIYPCKVLDTSSDDTRTDDTRTDDTRSDDTRSDDTRTDDTRSYDEIFGKDVVM